MTWRTTTTMRSPGRRVFFDDDLPDPGREAAAAIAALRFEVTLIGRTTTLDMTRLHGRRQLAQSLAGALWRACQVGGPAGSLSTARGFADSACHFWRYLDAKRADVQALSDVDVACIDGLDAWMEEAGLHPNNRLHHMSKILGLLRLADVAEPGRLADSASRRLLYTSDRRGVPHRPRDAYSDRIAASLRKAARTDIAALIRRFAGAQEPSASASARITMLEASVMDVIDKAGAIAVRDSLYVSLTHARRVAGLSNEGLIYDLHSRRHLLLADLVPLFVLLSLDTGLEIEAIKTLRADCLKNPTGGYVEIEYCKRRARNAEWKRLRVRDGGSSTPGGIIRLMRQWTEAARRRLGSDMLCAHHAWGRLSDVILPLPAPTRRWMQRHSIVDDEGKPFRLNLARLRKTHKAAWYRRTGGQLRRFAVGHSIEVAANHYADVPALRPVHEATIAAAMTDALEDALLPCILPPDAEAAVLAQPGNAIGLPVNGASEIEALLGGDQDVWLASCGGFYRSPFATEGEACPVPFWGCLECRNSVITARKLPALIAFLDFISAQRASLSELDWNAKFGRVHRRLAEQILPRFPATEIEAARAIAARSASLVYLPPEAGMA